MNPLDNSMNKLRKLYHQIQHLYPDLYPQENDADWWAMVRVQTYLIRQFRNGPPK